MRVTTLGDGARGLDANTPITAKAAAAFVAKGYQFAIRYVRRTQPHAYDLTATELLAILDAGLGLMAVQHVAPENWTPTGDVGTEYGAIAASECQWIGIPTGVTVWCDLEGVQDGVPHADVIACCANWYAAVAGAGYVPGLYVGFGAGLTGEELYEALPFQAYWSAYNLDRDKYPAVRGVQMRQLSARGNDLIPGFTTDNLDVDVIQRDRLGGTPSVLVR